MTKTQSVGLRLIKSDTGKSLYVVGDTKPIYKQLKALKDLAFEAKWNNKKQAWNIVPKKNKMDSVLAQLRHLFAIQAQQAEQLEEISGSVAWTQPPPKIKAVKAVKAVKAIKPVKPVKPVKAVKPSKSKSIVLSAEAVKAATGASKAAGGMNVADIKIYLKSIGVSIQSSYKRSDLERELKKLI